MKQKRFLYTKIFTYSLVAFSVAWASLFFILQSSFTLKNTITVLSPSAQTETVTTEPELTAVSEVGDEPTRVETIAMPTQEATSSADVLPVVQKEVPTISPATLHIPAPIIPKKTTPSPLVPFFDADEMLNAHNDVRADVDIAPLTWSSSLARSAQGWATTLKKRGCVMEHDALTKYGENIYVYWSGAGNGTSYQKTPTFVVGRFASEKIFYNYSKNTCRRGEDCGHYTQIVWEETTEVGCGVSMCYDGDIQTEVWVCRYNPAGNNGLRPY